jgi:hypothetical protein
LLAWLEEAFTITILAVEMFAALRRRRPRFAGVRTMRSPINNVMLVEKWNCGVEVCPKYLMGEIVFGK